MVVTLSFLFYGRNQLILVHISTVVDTTTDALAIALCRTITTQKCDSHNIAEAIIGQIECYYFTASVSYSLTDSGMCLAQERQRGCVVAAKAVHLRRNTLSYVLGAELSFIKDNKSTLSMNEIKIACYRDHLFNFPIYDVNLKILRNF